MMKMGMFSEQTEEVGMEVVDNKSQPHDMFREGCQIIS